MVHAIASFSARVSICLARYTLSSIARPSVSVRHMGGSVCQKRLEVRIMQFSPYGSPIPLVFVGGKFHPEILKGSLSGGVKHMRVHEKNQPFSIFMHQYLENGKR